MNINLFLESLVWINRQESIFQMQPRILKLASTFFILILVLVAVGGTEGKSKKKPCKEHPMLSGPCYKVKGRMSLFNGSPGIRIWPIGTKRMLGISEGRFYLEDYSYVPDELERQLNWQNAMIADFTVCPFTEDKPGMMRLICVESAENISIIKWK